MRGNRGPSGDMPGQDSFLDIVANMVGILIILVMVVGARASYAPLDAAPAEDDSPSRPTPSQLTSQALSLEANVRELDSQAQRMQQQLSGRDMQREVLATQVTAIRRELENRRRALDEDSRRQFDLRHTLADSQAKLHDLKRQQSLIGAERPRTIKIQNLPTPLSKTVHGRELHFQLRDGRVAFIPLNELLEEFKSAAQHKLWKLDGQSEMSDSVGPMGGFRLRYHLGRFDVPPEVQMETGRVGSVIQLTRWELLPVSAQLGEPLDVALAEGSQFRRALSRVNPRADTLTLWTYPDSFHAFRRLKADLHSLGYATAGRPLPAGQPIGGSPQGTRSAAQ